VLGEHPADRLDPEHLLVLGDERHYHGSRESSSRAKKLDADSRILFGALEFHHLVLELPDPLAVRGRGPLHLPGVDRDPLAPSPQRVRVDSHPRPYQTEGGVHRQARLLLTRLPNQTHRALRSPRTAVCGR